MTPFTSTLGDANGIPGSKRFSQMTEDHLSDDNLKSPHKMMPMYSPTDAVMKMYAHSWIVPFYFKTGSPTLYNGSLEDIFIDLEIKNEYSKKMGAAFEAQEQRMNHAIKRLKEKNLYFSTCAQIFSHIQNSKDLRTLQMATMLYSSFYYSLDKNEISENTWKMAIEFLVFSLDPDLYYSDSFLAIFLEQNCTALYMMVLLVYWAQMFSNNLYHSLSQPKEDPLAQSMKELESLKAANSQLEHKVSELKDNLAASKAKISELEKRHWREMLARDAENRALSKLLQEDDPLEPEAIEAPPTEIQDPAINDPHPFTEQELLLLPETGVLFLGGHQNIHKALTNYFPDWQYININDSTFSVPKSCKIVFCWYNHITHSAYQRLKRNMIKGTPICYVTATNPDRLILEMREQYTSEQLKQTGK